MQRTDARHRSVKHLYVQQMCVLRMHEMHLCACAPNVTKSEVNSVCERLTHACQQDRL